MSLTPLTGNETFHVVGQYNGRTPSGRSLLTTTGAVAALAGGAGSGKVTTIASGLSYTSSGADNFISWNSVTPGAKNTYIDTSSMIDGQVIVVQDYGAGNYSQTVQALQGDVTINNEASYTFTMANGVSINLKFDAETANLIVW
jgi:hypothetical protein